MKDGEIITKGNPNDVITEEMVKAIYGRCHCKAG